MEILIVEDDTANRNLFCFQAEEVDFNVRITVASNGRDALGRLARSRWDLMLLDLGIPAPDGFEVLRRTAASERPPVFVITAHDLSAEEHTELAALGVIRVFQKGRYDTRSLADAITSLTRE